MLIVLALSLCDAAEWQQSNVGVCFHGILTSSVGQSVDKNASAAAAIQLLILDRQPPPYLTGRLVFDDRGTSLAAFDWRRDQRTKITYSLL